jgi:hypothetical protein
VNRTTCLAIAICLRLIAEIVSGQTKEPDAIPHTGNVDAMFAVNSNLPLNVIELRPDYKWQASGFWQSPPTRPANMPRTAVLVQVLQRSNGYFRFVGWAFMEAESVNYLHGKTTQNNFAPPPMRAAASQASTLDTALERNNNMFPKSAYVYVQGNTVGATQFKGPAFTLRGGKPRIVHTHAKVVRNAGRVAANLFDRPLRVI